MQLRWLIERYEYTTHNKRWSAEPTTQSADQTPKLQYRYDNGGPWFDVPTEIVVSNEEERRAKHERQEIVECRA